ncbi:hypothetical protein SETIT_4G013100v2 [Setaria italica]|uniref:Uncharacterized protein n=1 Tax=Setaria italica TaxID=4555 RepID=A0A368QPJ9_SETIT|nr:hypothetical protein SETIT_4G013100v2 [Setaria italica]
MKIEPHAIKHRYQVSDGRCGRMHALGMEEITACMLRCACCRHLGDQRRRSPALAPPYRQTAGERGLARRTRKKHEQAKPRAAPMIPARTIATEPNELRTVFFSS